MSRDYDNFAASALPPANEQPEFLFTLPGLLYPERLNAVSRLLGHPDSDALAVINDAGRWTYAEMDRLSDGIARLLREEEGLIPGNRVLIRGPNTAMLFAACVASLSICILSYGADSPFWTTLDWATR